MTKQNGSFSYCFHEIEHTGVTLKTTPLKTRRKESKKNWGGKKKTRSEKKKKKSQLILSQKMGSIL